MGDSAADKEAAKPDEENAGDGPVGISNLVSELSRYLPESQNVLR